MRPQDPRRKKLGEMKQLVLRKMMDADDVGRVLIADDLGIPPERFQEFDLLVKEMQQGRTQQAVTDPYSAVAGTMQDIGMQFPQQQPQTNGAQVAQAPQATPRGALVRLRDAVKNAQGEGDLQAIMDQLGIQSLTPEEEAFVTGG
jgi:hypothetical protein